MSWPKILVGCPTSQHKEYCLDQYVNGVRQFKYQNFDVLLVDNSEGEEYAQRIREKGVECCKVPYSQGVMKRLADSRNVLRERVLTGGYDYFLSLEQDVIPPPIIIGRLLAHGKKVVSGLYTKLAKIKDQTGRILRTEQVPVAYVWDESIQDARRLLRKEMKNKGLMRIIGGGLGCLLIHRSVLEKIEFRVADPSVGCDDMYFFNDLHDLGIAAFCDTGALCKHLEVAWDAVVRNS